MYLEDKDKFIEDVSNLISQKSFKFLKSKMLELMEIRREQIYSYEQLDEKFSSLSDDLEKWKIFYDETKKIINERSQDE